GWIQPVIWTLVLLFTFLEVPGAGAGPPTDQLRDGIDRVVQILKDPELEGPAKTGQRRTELVKVADDLFDFRDIARRAMGPHWDGRTATERGEFVHVFTQLFQRSYVAQVDQHASEKMIIRSEIVDGDDAVVRTVLTLGAGREMPLAYRMHAGE